MAADNKDKDGQNELPKAGTGNASNPSPLNDETQAGAGPEQLIDKKGEKYLRESGNIEDYPDAQEE